MNPYEFYNLSVEMRGILAYMEETGGELTPELEARLDALGADTNDRLTEMAMACRELDGLATIDEREEKRFATRRRSKRNRVALLREYITDHMAQTGTPKVVGELVTVSLVEGDERALWEGKDENIPESYRRTFVEHRLDQEAVLRDRADGKAIPEGIRIKKSRHIRIT